MSITEPRLCPFLNKPCIKEGCQIWNNKDKNYSIAVTTSLLNAQIMNEAAKGRVSMYPQK